MSLPYLNVYPFSIILKNGFTAVIQCLDGNKVPMDFTGATAEMQLTRVIDDVLEFSWTTTNGLITLGDATVNFNVPPADMTPALFVLQDEKYPYQNYTYELQVNPPSGPPLVDISGDFVIFQV